MLMRGPFLLGVCMYLFHLYRGSSLVLWTSVIVRWTVVALDLNLLQLKRWLEENSVGGKGWLRFDPLARRFYCHRRSIKPELAGAAADLLQEDPHSLIAATPFGRVDSAIGFGGFDGDSVAVTGKRGRAAAARVRQLHHDALYRPRLLFRDSSILRARLYP